MFLVFCISIYYSKCLFHNYVRVFIFCSTIFCRYSMHLCKLLLPLNFASGTSSSANQTPLSGKITIILRKVCVYFLYMNVCVTCIVLKLQYVQITWLTVSVWGYTLYILPYVLYTVKNKFVHPFNMEYNIEIN